MDTEKQMNVLKDLVSIVEILKGKIEKLEANYDSAKEEEIKAETLKDKQKQSNESMLEQLKNDFNTVNACRVTAFRNPKVNEENREVKDGYADKLTRRSRRRREVQRKSLIQQLENDFNSMPTSELEEFSPRNEKN